MAATGSLYLIIYPSHPFADHWALFIPSSSSNPTNTDKSPTPDNKSPEPRDLPPGTLLQVSGDPLTGFQHDFVRDYDFRDEGRKVRVVVLGEIGEDEDEDEGEDGEGERRGERKGEERITEVAKGVEAPGRSLRQVQGGGGGCEVCFNLLLFFLWLVWFVFEVFGFLFARLCCTAFLIVMLT